MADRLGRVLLDPECAARLRSFARQWVMAEFSTSRLAQKTEAALPRMAVKICIVSPFAYGALMEANGPRWWRRAADDPRRQVVGHPWPLRRSRDVGRRAARRGKPRRRPAAQDAEARRRQPRPALLPTVAESDRRVGAIGRGCLLPELRRLCHRSGRCLVQSRNNRRFVYSVASDPDCDRRLPKLPLLRERVLYSLRPDRTRHRIIVQTNRQRGMLNDSFGLGSLVLPMPCPLLPGAMRKGHSGATCQRRRASFGSAASHQSSDSTSCSTSPSRMPERAVRGRRQTRHRQRPTREGCSSARTGCGTS